MGTHLPSTEFDGTAVDDQREADAEAVLGEPAAPMVQLLGPDGKLGADPVFSSYADKLTPDAQGNFVWLALGAESAAFAELAGTRALSVRAFPGEGVRVSIGEAEANTRFLQLCADYTKAPASS